MPISYFLNDAKIEQVDYIKDLGVLIDSKLMFTKHGDEITLQALKILGLITRTGKDFCSPQSTVNLYFALVLSILE